MGTEGFVVIAAGVVLFALISGRLRDSVLPPPLVFTAFGLLIGQAVLGITDLDVGDRFIHGLAEVTLILVLFSDAARIDLRQVRADHDLPVRMLLVGTPLVIVAGTTRTGEVFGQTAPRHTSDDFLAFLTQVVDSQPRQREIHIILDNLATHKTQKVRTFLATHTRVHLHFTPTYSSWLNQVELWFAKIERDVLARGIFTSVADLRRKILRYIRRYNDEPKPIRWAYADPSRRIA